MKKLYIAVIIILIFVLLKATIFTSKSHEQIVLGKWNPKKIDKLIQRSLEKKNTGEKINYISSIFLGNKYQASTLIGDKDTPEVLVINLEDVDCFTYIDYVEALAISNSYNDFKKKLKYLRYKDGKVDFQKRNHFFSDWAVYNSKFIKDATKEIGGDSAIKVHKKLNAKDADTVFLPGIEITERDVWYIPSSKIDDKVISKIQTGDFVGLYSNNLGLDVSHVGIAVRRGDKVYYRNASSKKQNMKVVDEELLQLINNDKYPGIVVLRSQ